MEYSTIQFKKEGEIGYIFLNRPKQLNSINKKMIEELYYLIDEEIENDDELGVIIITGNEKIFCAGGEHQYQKCVLGPILIFRLCQGFSH